MKASSVKKAVKTAYALKEPVFISGSPGVGKSEVVRQAADELKVGMADVRVLQMDPVDLRGLPVADNDKKEVRWIPPNFLPKKGEGILFLDELTAAPPLMQAACYQLILDRRLGDYTLPAGWSVVGAGNREGDRAVVSRMPSALANRFLHIAFDVDLEDWVLWAGQNSIRPELIAFLRWRPNLLNAFDPQKQDKAFPTPRSNAKLSRFLDADPDIDYEIAAGITGESHATEFLGFLKIVNGLPDIDLIIKAPETVSFDAKDPAILYALCGALAHKATRENFENIIKFAERMSPEFSILLVRDALNLTPDLTSTTAFIQWSTKNADVLI